MIATSIVMAFVLGLVALAEALLSWYGLGNPVLYYESETYRYAVKPSQQTVRLRNSAIRIDDRGSRTNDVWDSEGVRKVLFVGDSVTYGGSYIDNSQLFSSVVCKHLRSRSQPSVCGNIGTNGYGVENMAFRIRFDANLRPDTYVVTILGDDALRGLAALSSFPYFSRPLPALVPAITEATMFAVDRIRAELRFDRASSPYQGKGPHARDVARMALERLFESLRIRQKEGASVLLVYSPLRSAASGDYTEFDQFVISTLGASGFPVLDMRSSIRVEGGDLDSIYYDGAHLDVRGHQFYGAVIADHLMSLRDGR